MYLYFLFFNIIINSVYFVESLENSLSLSVDPNADFYRVFLSENRSIFDTELVQKFVVFNNENETKIVARFGTFSASSTSKSILSPMSVHLHTDRHAFIVPTESNTIIINSLCEFFYEHSYMSTLDSKFCCTMELHVNKENVSNPIASCEMRLGSQPSFCFTPLTITNTADLQPIIVLTATVHRLQSKSCVIPQSPSSTKISSSIYAISTPMELSFSKRPPIIWQLADYNDTKLLLGLPIHSSRLGENLLIPLRQISVQSPATTQILYVRCIVDDRISVIAIVPNSPIATMLTNDSFYNLTHMVYNIGLQIMPGRDRELFSLNATLTSDSLPNGAVDAPYPTLQCCIIRSSDSRQRSGHCGKAPIVSVPMKFNSMVIIPALKTFPNIFSIYNTAKVLLHKDDIQVYGIVNYRDRNVALVTQQVKVTGMIQGLVQIATDDGAKIQKSTIDMQYQDYLNPWSIQLSIYDSRYTVLAPVKIWRADSWRLVLSHDVLRPIQNWEVPKTTNDVTSCVPHYMVARLKILCRLYMLDESGRKHYVGEDSFQDGTNPFIDVTSSTLISQFRLLPANVVHLEKSNQDGGHFLVSANEIGQSATIELLTLDSSQSLSSTRVSVESEKEPLQIVDLIIRCVDALTLKRHNATAGNGRAPLGDMYESITVTMTTDTQRLPCYLLVFLVFNDQSVERLSFFDHNQYQMFLVYYSPLHQLSSTPISDGQLVTVKWSKQANVTLFQSTSCNTPKLIFSKKINWSEIVPLSNFYSATNFPPDQNIQVTSITKVNQLLNNQTDTPNNLMQTSLYITFAILAFFFLCLIIYKILSIKLRSRHSLTVPACYHISDSGFLNDHQKLQIRHSNSKTFSSIGKYSTNCIKNSNSNNKSNSNEPYPPLLPPPGPISTNYDMTLNDRICGESAVDSGIELGKLSNYSSTTNPSNDMSPSMFDDNPYRTSPQFSSSSFGHYYPPQKDIMDSIHSYNDHCNLKSISNLRPPLW